MAHFSLKDTKTTVAKIVILFYMFSTPRFVLGERSKSLVPQPHATRLWQLLYSYKVNIKWLKNDQMAFVCSLNHSFSSSSRWEASAAYTFW